MCITRERWKTVKQWNWDGDYVIHECVVPSSRKAIGSQRPYDIDVREFLLSERNEVMRRTIKEDLRRHVACMPDRDWDRFNSRSEGSFDYRVRVIADFVAEKISYPAPAPRGSRRGAVTVAKDPWQFPDETLVIGAGDCEDRALLIASLLLAAGISSFHVRVALGKMTANGRKKDHVWVMYKNESGQWTVVDPAPTEDRVAAASARSTKTTEPPSYEPYFLFNDVHLWSIRRPDNDDRLRDWLMRAWDRIDPAFHGAVHLTIIERALRGVAPQMSREIEKMFRRAVLGIFGPLVDDIDRMPYDPAWHFDNGYIEAGWDHVEKHLSMFRADHSRVREFAIAAHAIADFYAHSSYAHFAHPRAPGKLPGIFDVRRRPLGGLAAPDYSKGSLSLLSKRFSVNGAVLKQHTLAEVAAAWKGQIISGRYAQDRDTQPGLVNHLFMEGVTWIPDHYLREADFWKRGGLPHHNEIAVDEEDGDGHRLYSGKHYTRQFELRRDLAIEHIQQAFERSVGGDP